MTFGKNMKTSFLIALFFLLPASVFAGFIPMKVTLSDTVAGLDKGVPHEFVVEARFFDLSFPIDNAKDFSPPFNSPEKLVARGTWLQRSGDFSGYRSHLGKPAGISEKDFILMTSDDLLVRKQEFLKKVTKFEPLLLIEVDSEETFYFFYRLSGGDTSVIYIASLLKTVDGQYVYRGGQLSNPEIKALFNAMVQEEISKKNCYSILPK